MAAPALRPRGAVTHDGAAEVPGGDRALQELPYRQQQPKGGSSTRPCRGGSGAVVRRTRRCCLLVHRRRLRFGVAGLRYHRVGHASFANPAVPQHRRGALMSSAPHEQLRYRLGGGAATRQGSRASRGAQRSRRRVLRVSSRRSAPRGRVEALQYMLWPFQ